MENSRLREGKEKKKKGEKCLEVEFDRIASTGLTCKDRLVYVSTDSAESTWMKVESQRTARAGDMKENEEAR